MRLSGNKSPACDLFRLLCGAAAASCVALFLWITAEMAWMAWPALRVRGLAIVASSQWNPNVERFGFLSYLLGTVSSSLIAIGLALPLGVLIAVFLSEDYLPPFLRQAFRFLVEMLAAIPSVVYGLWGMAVVIPLLKTWGEAVAAASGDHVPLVAGPVYGNSLLTASLVLALMILPTITAISRNAIEAVPPALREGGHAIGATRWEIVWRIVLPLAAPGIVASAVLALARAMGETMAVAMLIGNSPRLSWSLFSPSGTLAGLLANQFAEARGLAVGALMCAALLLLLMTLAVNLLGDWILRLSRLRVKGVA